MNAWTFNPSTGSSLLVFTLCVIQSTMRVIFVRYFCSICQLIFQDLLVPVCRWKRIGVGVFVLKVNAFLLNYSFVFQTFESQKTTPIYNYTPGNNTTTWGPRASSFITHTAPLVLGDDAVDHQKLSLLCHFLRLNRFIFCEEAITLHILQSWSRQRHGS